MSDLERPTTPVSAKVVGVVVIGLLAWLLFGSALSVVKAVIALVGYVIVGFAAFHIGKAAGKRER
ncbi:MAG: hypothetical protein FJW86_09680 [Actinobacteria bacterium]|nr:hypothetical protein [Actinomycetota bacterium]